ncbi:MAG: LapA family protein [Azospirillum sp.]|nr:LapA family protein [Azospirillum sp.]
MSFFKLIIGLPLIIIIAVIAFMNNEMVTINLWPFYIEITATLSVVIIFLALFGYIIGKLDSWVSYAPLRLALRNQLRQNKKLNAEQQRLVEKVEGLKENLENIKTNEPANAQPVEKANLSSKLKQKFSGLFKSKPKQDDFWCL